MAAAQNRDRRLGGAEQNDLVALRRAAERRNPPALAGRERVAGAGERARMRFRAAAVLAGNDDRRQPAERRQGAAPALLGLLGVEALGVAGDERGDHRMLRLPGLQQRAAGPVAAAGASRRLAQQLEGAFGGARIAVRQADVGVDDPDQRQQREIVALGDELGADDHVVFAARRRVELRAQPLDPAGEVGRQHQRPRVREQRRDLFGEALDAGAAGGERVGLETLRADFRPRLVVAAMVADERLAETVLDQPGGAVRALEAMAAGAAEGQRRVAAAVEEQQRLFAGGEARFDRRDQARRQPAAARRAFAAKVDRGKVGHRPLAEARRQLQPVVAAALGVDARLQRRRRRSENHRRALQPARAPPPCRARGRRRRPPACRRPRAPRRRRSGRDRRRAGTAPTARRRPRALRRWRRRPTAARAGGA